MRLPWDVVIIRIRAQAPRKHDRGDGEEGIKGGVSGRDIGDVEEGEARSGRRERGERREEGARLPHLPRTLANADGDLPESLVSVYAEG